MAAFAASTSRIKLGQMCTAMSYRNPVYLAKVPRPPTSSPADGSRWVSAAAGTSTSGAPTGTASRRPEVRLARLDEGVQIMRDAWRDGRVTFDGKQYQVDDAIVAPKPLQPGGIPLWIAGGGEKGDPEDRRRSTRSTPTSAPTPTSSPTSRRVLAEHCRGSAPTTPPSSGRPTSTRSSGRRMRTSPNVPQRVRSRLAGVCGDAAADAMMADDDTGKRDRGPRSSVIETDDDTCATSAVST